MRLNQDNSETKRSQITYHLGQSGFETEKDCQMWAQHSRSHQRHGHEVHKGLRCHRLRSDQSTEQVQPLEVVGSR